MTAPPRFAAQLAALRAADLHRRLVEPHGIDLSSNDYLGLGDHPGHTGVGYGRRMRSDRRRWHEGRGLAAFICPAFYSSLRALAPCLHRPAHQRADLIVYRLCLSFSDMSVACRRRCAAVAEELADHQSAIGIWRTRDEFTRLADDAGWDSQIRVMPTGSWAAHYRYDVLLTRGTPRVA